MDFNDENNIKKDENQNSNDDKFILDNHEVSGKNSETEKVEENTHKMQEDMVNNSEDQASSAPNIANNTQNINFGADDIDIENTKLNEVATSNEYSDNAESPAFDSDEAAYNDKPVIDLDQAAKMANSDVNSANLNAESRTETNAFTQALSSVEEKQRENLQKEEMEAETLSDDNANEEVPVEEAMQNEPTVTIDSETLENLKGKSIMLEGLDGSGKGVILDGLKEHFASLGLKVFDLKEYWKTSNNIPDVEEIGDYDVILVSEPTLAMIGKVIREEIIRTQDERSYSGLTTAHAFSLDREILYRKLLIPAKASGKIIVQERGIVSSLIYQPVQNESLNIKDIIALPGNKLAIKNAPDLILITRVEPLVVMERLKQREKKDNAIFENLFFQRKIQLRYESTWLTKLFAHYNSKIVYIDTNPPSTVEETKTKAIDAVNEL